MDANSSYEIDQCVSEVRVLNEMLHHTVDSDGKPNWGHSRAVPDGYGAAVLRRTFVDTEDRCSSKLPRGCGPSYGPLSDRE